jgi:hypothetical protein
MFNIYPSHLSSTSYHSSVSSATSLPSSAERKRDLSSPKRRPQAKEEVQKILGDLMKMIPGITADQSLSTLEMMQTVIDYIQDLEETLESNGSSGSGRSGPDVSMLFDLHCNIANGRSFSD